MHSSHGVTTSEQHRNAHFGEHCGSNQPRLCDLLDCSQSEISLNGETKNINAYIQFQTFIFIQILKTETYV